MAGCFSRYACLGMAVAALALPLAGCETDSYFDPSFTGRWEQTPVILPILTRIDVIEDTGGFEENFTDVRPEDLEVEAAQYRVGSGDLVTVTSWQIRNPGQPDVQTLRVTDDGFLRLSLLGEISVQGLTERQIERRITQRIAELGLVREAEVNVQVLDQRNNTYTIIGEPDFGSTRIGTYQIPKRGYTILEAVAQAGGVPGRTKRLLVFRPIVPVVEIGGSAEGNGSGAGDSPTSDPTQPISPVDLIDQIFSGQLTEESATMPVDFANALEEPDAQPRWVYVDGQWVKSEPSAQPIVQGSGEGVSESELTNQVRVIAVPWNRLFQGDLSNNIIIRPGDVIQVPPPTGGNVYIGGAVNRPGTYGLPGENDLTLKQLITSAGGLSGIAIPERVDLVRRIDERREATVRLNYRAIAEGNHPDFFLKPSDTINVGTNFWAAPLAVIRNGFRFSYGFGFIWDRNFWDDDD